MAGTALLLKPPLPRPLESEVYRYPHVEGFSESVREGLAAGIVTVKELSDEFALIPKIVDFWAKGIDVPHPSVQHEILALLAKRRPLP